MTRFWRQCYFRSFAYYMVGAAAVGLMVATMRSAGWMTSLLILPPIALVYLSYGLHVAEPAGRTLHNRRYP